MAVKKMSGNQGQIWMTRKLSDRTAHMLGINKSKALDKDVDR